MQKPPTDHGTASDRPIRLLTMGGCNVLEIGKALTDFCEHRHIWNVTWPSLGSRPMKLKTWPAEPLFGPLGAFILRETEKRHGDLIRSAKPDVLLLSVAQNVLNDFVVAGASVIPDFTGHLYLSEDRLQGQARPSIATFAPDGCRVVQWRDKEFPKLLKVGFKQAYRRILAPLIARGMKVVVHHHVLATQALTTEGLEPEGDADTRRQMRIVADAVAFAGTFPGVFVLEQEPSLNLTSADAPGGGRWAFHAILEQYIILAHRLALLIKPDRADAVLTRFLLENRRTHLRTQAALAQAESSHQPAEAARQTLQALQDELGAVKRTLSWRVTAPLRSVRRLLPRRTA